MKKPLCLMLALLLLCLAALAETVPATEDEALQRAEVDEALRDTPETDVVRAMGDIRTDGSVLNILLLATDERKDEFSEKAHCDTIMLFSIDLRTHAISLVSIERAIGVPILEGRDEGKFEWLNLMFERGGTELMLREVRECFRVDVEYYVRLNMRTFLYAIDALGGIDLELSRSEASYVTSRTGRISAKEIGVLDDVQSVSAGMNHLNGATAMVIARCRAVDSDWGRIERQRRVLGAAIEKLSTLDPVRMVNMLLGLIPRVDTNLTITEYLKLANLAPELIGGEIRQLTIPPKGTYGNMRGLEGKSMYSLDFEENSRILNEFLYGEG